MIRRSILRFSAANSASPSPGLASGCGVFLIIEALILFVCKLEHTQSHMRGLIERNSLEFGTYYSSLMSTFTIMLLSMFLLGSIYFALLAGDIVTLFVTDWLAFQTRDFKT